MPEGDELPAVGAHADVAQDHRSTELPPPTSPLPWLLAGAGGLALVGWLLERRRRRSLEMERDSMLWAQGDGGRDARA